MQTNVQEIASVDITKHQTDLLVIGVVSQQEKQGADPQHIDPPLANQLNQALGIELSTQAKQQGFTGKEGEQFVVHTLGKIPARSVAYVGLGQQNGGQSCPDTYRRWAGRACQLAKKMRADHVTVCLPAQHQPPPSGWLQAIYEGALLACYRFDRYLTQSTQPPHEVKQFTVLCEQTQPAKEIFEQASGLAQGVCLARDLVNEGANVVTPQSLAQQATQLGGNLGLQVDVLNEQQLKQERMHMMLAVGRASNACTPPRLIRLAYEPSETPAAQAKRIVLVGKGLTFDSGGLNLKPTASIRDMKLDMSGAACVFGALVAAARMKLPYPVIGYLACAENGIGAHAYHPGDVLHSRKGITVEIDNTDAEGRLVLADTIDYACERDKPHALIDVATLTGACMVALGLRTAGLFCKDSSQASTMCRLAKDCGELFWQLPLDTDNQMEDELKSTVADTKNCGSRYGGSSTAALFLRKFVPNSVQWAHLDIAGPAFAQKEEAYIAKGGTGFGVRTLISLVQNQQKIWSND
ncbi:MAG: leucyl aminopeptidase [Myxococcota bacterium]